MSDTLSRVREFMLTHARLLERWLFEVEFAGADPASVAQFVRAYQKLAVGWGTR